MTRVKVRNGARDHLIEAKGHASGSAAVCNGVSAILYALAGWLTNNGHGDAVRKMDAGDAVISLESLERDVEVAFSEAIIGLMQIEHRYPDYISIAVKTD